MEHKLGLIGPDPKEKGNPKHNDWVWSDYGNIRLPKRAGVLPRITRIEDQQDLNACVYNAGTSVEEFVVKEFLKTYEELSRLFAYYVGREEDGTDPYDDVGSYCRTFVKIAHKIGICREELWPYDTNNYHVKPTQECYEDAKNHRIKSYHRIITLRNMKACLTIGRPFILGIPLFKKFFSDEVAATGDVPMPIPFFDSIMGYHAIYGAFYDDDIERVYCINSWGKDWGKLGVFTLPYAYLKKFVEKSMISDVWMILR